MNPMVSVIMPVYNNDRTVGQAIRSILAQSFTDFELLILDDGSTDGSLERIAMFSDERIRVIEGGDNIGLPRRLNQLVDAARGQLIARMDADDASLPSRLEKQVAFLSDNPDVDLVGAQALTFRDQAITGMLPARITHEELVARPWNNIPLPHPTWMGRREWFTRNRYAVPEIWRAEDQDLLLRAHATSRYACLDEPLLCYRQGEPDYSKIATARRQQLQSQCAYFAGKGRWLDLARAGTVFVVKSTVDMWRRLTGRMAGARPIPSLPGAVERACREALRP